MKTPNVTPLWRDPCSCKTYRTPNGFSIAYCPKHKEAKRHAEERTQG